MRHQAILLGVVAAFFFTFTLFLNRVISVEDTGSWVWTAACRYLFMLPLLLGWLVVRRVNFHQLWVSWKASPWFWIRTGIIGFGLFYGPIAYAAYHIEGWVLAAVWQTTTLSSFVIMYMAGYRKLGKGLVYTFIGFIGVLLVTLGVRGEWQVTLWHAILPIIVAGLAYPFGNQSIKEATDGSRRLWSPDLSKHEVLRDQTVCLFLVTVGSLPAWLGLIGWYALTGDFALPTAGQSAKVAVIAITAGIIATATFWRARKMTKDDPGGTVAVDATQTSEVAFCFTAEAYYLGVTQLNLISLGGVACIFLGLALHTLNRYRKAKSESSL